MPTKEPEDDQTTDDTNTKKNGGKAKKSAIIPFFKINLPDFTEINTIIQPWDSDEEDIDPRMLGLSFRPIKETGPRRTHEKRIDAPVPGM